MVKTFAKLFIKQCSAVTEAECQDKESFTAIDAQRSCEILLLFPGKAGHSLLGKTVMMWEKPTFTSVLGGGTLLSFFLLILCH